MSILLRASPIRLSHAWKMEGWVVLELNSSPSGMLSTRTILTGEGEEIILVYICTAGSAYKIQNDRLIVQVHILLEIYLL